MANRRMFSNRIANSARFLQMPVESQLLYFHMILRADDDGIVESYPLMKLLGVAPDNFKVLCAKGFIRELNQDQVIVIMDWLEHNVIRSDRKVNSIYQHLLKEKAPELPILEAKPRSDVEDNSRRLSGGQSTDGISKVRLGKDIGNKNKIATQNVAELNPLIDSFKEVNPSYKNLFGNKTQRAALQRMTDALGIEKLMQIIAVLPKTNAMQYAPTITTPYELENNMGRLKAFFDKQKSSKLMAIKL